MRLITVGHGTADREQFGFLLHGAVVMLRADRKPTWGAVYWDAQD